MVTLHKYKLLNTVIVIFIIFSGSYAYCTEELEKKAHTTDRLFTEMAVITGFGTGNITKGSYQTILLIGHFGVDLKRYFRKL